MSRQLIWTALIAFIFPNTFDKCVIVVVGGKNRRCFSPSSWLFSVWCRCVFRVLFLFSLVHFISHSHSFSMLVSLSLSFSSATVDQYTVTILNVCCLCAIQFKNTGIFAYNNIISARIWLRARCGYVNWMPQHAHVWDRIFWTSSYSFIHTIYVCANNIFHTIRISDSII